MEAYLEGYGITWNEGNNEENNEMNRIISENLTFGVRCYRSESNGSQWPIPKTTDQRKLANALSNHRSLMLDFGRVSRDWNWNHSTRRMNNEELWSSQISSNGRNLFLINTLFLCIFGGDGFGDDFFLGRCTTCRRRMPADRGCLHCIRNRRNYYGSTISDALECMSYWHMEQLESDTCLECQMRAVPEVRITAEFWDPEEQEYAEELMPGEEEPEYDDWRPDTPSEHDNNDQQDSYDYVNLFRGPLQRYFLAPGAAILMIILLPLL